MAVMFVGAGRRHTRRHTPRPAYARFAVLGLFGLGMALGLLGAGIQLWSLHLSLDARAAGDVFPALAAGLAAALFAGRGRAETVGPGVRVLFIVSGLTAALALAAASFAYEAALLPLPMLLLGAALGGFARASAALLEHIVVPRRSRSARDLAGVAFCLGGLTGCLLIRAAVGFVSPDGILRALAVLPLPVAAAAWRAWRFRFSAPGGGGPRAGRRGAFSLNFFLLGSSLLLQCAAYGIAACWLTAYLSRALGLTTRGGLTALVVFWAAAAAGRAAAVRLPSLGESLLSLGGSAAACCLGCLFLLQTAQPSGAAAGAALLGLGLSSLHVLTLRMMERCVHVRGGGLRGFWFASLAAVMPACWLVGRFAGELGIELAVWAPLGCVLAAAAALLIFAAEHRVSGASALA